MVTPTSYDECDVNSQPLRSGNLLFSQILLLTGSERRKQVKRNCYLWNDYSFLL